MSTHAQPTRTKRTDRQTDRSATTESTSAAGAATENRPTAGRPRPGERDAATAKTDSTTAFRATDGAWVERCQRQFDAGATARLANLVDEENQVVIAPGEA
ncbi:hypothetical protein D3D02_10445 [Halobellus sp. Atlit-38R]|uniref:hypothetical protein n=1 Tax=Halobellus sp. Atlit-38R TaxID=2282131 RepID=UPI000EF23416|nr:hypothetical protein [Halobellus sp. Atlit-38R]RLM88934.1 hypothetical protein D3D02_10445 [Halobellus sp. Atlit-38R]